MNYKIERGLYPGERKVLEYLLARESDGLSVVRYDEMGEELGMTRSSAHTAISSLRVAGIIERGPNIISFRILQRENK